MPEIKVPTADGRGLFFEIAGTEPSAAEKDFIAGHVQNYNSLYGPPPPAPPPPVEEMGPWRAGLMNLYADIDTAIGGGAQALGYDDTAQRYYEAAGQTREDVAQRYKPIDLYDVQGVGDFARFGYENLASSAAYLLPMAIGGFGSAGIAAGLGATRAGIGLAGAVGGAAGGTGPYTGQMASRQAEEQGVPLTDVDWGKALAYGTVASSLDLATPAVLGAFGKLASRIKVGDQAAKKAADGWFKRVGKNAFKGLATEAPIETAQQALEIFQANPEKFYDLGPEVQKELVTAFIAGGLLGGVMGGALGGYDVGSDTYRESDEEKKKSAQVLLDIEKLQANSENAAKIAKMRDEYQRALAEERQFESEDLRDLSFGLDTPRYRPSDEMARYRPEVIASPDGTAAGYRVAGPTGETVSEHTSFDAARLAAQTANDSAPYSPSIIESYPVIPTSSLETSTREALVKKRYEMGQAGLDNNTSLSEIRNLLGDGIAAIERERLTGTPQIPLQARMLGASPTPPPIQAPLEAQWRQFASPEVERMLRAVSAASAAPAAPVSVVNQPTPVDPQTATPVKKDPAVSTPPVKEAPPWGEELDLDGTGDEEGFTFQKGDLGGVDYAKRRRRIKEKTEAATSPDTAASTPSPQGPRFTVEAVDATTAEPEGANPRAMYDIFRDGKKVGSVRGLAEAQDRANKMQADNPTGSVVVRPKNRVFAVNEYRGSAQGDVFVSTIRTFRDQKAAQDYANTLNETRERRVKQRIANRDTIQRYENLLEKQKAAWQIAERNLKQMGAPPDLIVRVRGVLEDPNTGEADTGIEGYYDASAKLMAVSIDIWGPDLSAQELADRIAGVINHEFVHVLQRAGAFTKPEWKLLKKYLKTAQSYEPDGRMVKGQTWYERAKNIEQAGASEDKVLREAMSEAYRSWAKNKSTVTGKPASIFRRIVEIVKTLGRFGKSNPRIEQVFKEISEGKRSGVLRQGIPADIGPIDFSARKSDLTETGGPDERVLEQDLGRGRGGRGGVSGNQGRGYSPLPGAPVIKDATGPDPNVVEAARSYAKSAGIPFRRQAEYAKADPERGRRIADAYEKMPHAPQDPKVLEAYEDLKRQTRAQYDALIDAGYQFTFYDQYADPYGGNPMNAIRDLRKNKRMAVYGTYDGYGTEGVTGAAIENNPMLEDTGLTWPDQNGMSRPVTANDLFRAVHDAFGHSMEGAGFRADGEENAWQAHIRLYTGKAIGAATSELRGQNSWLNFGPYGEKNAKANVFDTVFAEQKTGLMPEWTWQEGIVPDEEAFVVPAEVRKPNGDIDFSKRNLALHQTGRYNNINLSFEDETGREINDLGVMVEYEVRLKDRPGGIGLLHGSIARGRPDLFYVEYASFDPDDMSIEETIGLINLLGKNFPKIRYITGQRISGAKYRNREKRLLAAAERLKAAKVVFANDIMKRARASSNADENAFFRQYRGAKNPDIILDNAARLVPDLYSEDTAASRGANEAQDLAFEITDLSVRQTINVGRMRDRGLVDFSRRKATIARVEKKKVETKTAQQRSQELAEKFQKNPDLFEVVTNVFGETMRVPRQITKGLPQLRQVIPYLREDELNTNIIGARGILEMFENAPDATEMAAVAISGRAKRGWYEQSARALIHVFGTDDAPRFSALLAALSPQTKVEDNAKNALNMWVNWDKAGRPTDRDTIIRILGQSVQGKKGEGSILDAWKNNSVTALQAIDPHSISISGNKVNSFMLNLNDVVHAVTNDAWMANYGDVDQNKFGGAGYFGYSAKVRMSAEIASELTGYNWTPREIQETVWSWAKTIYELRKKLGKAGGDQTVGDLLRAGRMTNAMVASTPDFATLFTDGVYRGILERGGYGNQIERIISDKRIARGSGQLDATFGARSVYDAEGAGIAPADYRRYLDTAAARLEQRYQRRKAEAAAKKAKGGRLNEGEDSDVDYSRRRDALAAGYTDPDPDEAARVEKGISGKSFDDVLDWLGFTAPTQDYRYIAGGVKSAIKAMREQGYSFSIKVAHVGDQVPSPLLYARGIAKANFDKKTVEVWLNGADVTGNVGMSYETLLHEMIHAATMAAIKVGNKKSMANTKAGKLTSNLYDVTNAIIKEFNERVRARGVDGLSDFERKIYKRLNNATQNVDEVLTWGLTNREMQEWLNTIPYKNQTLWSNLVDIVRNFLGLAERGQTALSEVLRIGDSFLQPDIAAGVDFDSLRVAKPAMPMRAGPAPSVNRDLDYSRRLVQTLEFKDWFGDSKVVGSDGQPLVVFHGTSKDKDFFAFNVPRNGAWFTGDIDIANDYAETNDSQTMVKEEGSWRMRELNTASRVIPVYLSIQNPYRFTDQDLLDMDSAPDRGSVPGYKAWQKDFFTDLRRRGYDGADLGNGTWVVLDSPTQIKSAIGNRGTFSKDNKRIDFSRVNPLTPADIANSVDRIRYTGVRNMLMNSLSKLGKPIGLTEARAKSISSAFLDNWVDHALPLGEIVDQVREKGGNISDAFDAMLKQQLWSSKAEQMIRQMSDKFYMPMIRALRALQVSDADIADFKRRFPEMSKLLEGNKDARARMVTALMYARHAPERNLVINAMNEGKLPNGSGVSTAEAEAVVKWFESRPNWNQYKLAEQSARRVIDETNNIRVAAGLTPDFRKIPANPIFQKLGMPNGYRHYVPLRGMLEEDTMPNDIDLQRLRTGRGLGIKGPEDISAKGRLDMANNVIEHIVLQNEVAVVRASKNEVNRAFYDLVKNNQAMLKEVAEIVTKAPMIRRIGDDGIVRLMPDMNYMNSDEYHITKIDGENHVIKVKDARLARTLNGGTGQGDAGIMHVINLIGGFTRFMSQMATGLNPEFWLRNTPRDVLTGAINIKQYEVEGGVTGLSEKLVSNWPTALKAARRANRFDVNYLKTGDERVAAPTDPTDVMYQEFLEDGGFTGYLGLQTIETKIANLNKQITKGEGSKLQEGLEVANRFKEFVEAINNSFENATRFAVYKTLRDTGFTRERAAQAAKTVTTNFNAGGWYKNLINPFYMFYNASIQGSIAILTAGVRSPKVRSALAAILIGGIMQDLVGSMLSEEDEAGGLKYDKVKEWMARTHMIIPDPTGMSEDGLIKVPLPFGFNAVYNFGRVMSKYARHQVMGGDYDLGKATASAIGTLLDATNPLGASQSFINYVAPTILDPVVSLTINRDFDDSIIVKRPISNVGVDLPSSQMYLSSTSPGFVGIADFLNTYSGGTTVMPGMIDVSPDALQYLFDYFLSGAGAFVRRTGELAAFGLPAALQGDLEGITPNKIPFVRAVVGSTGGVDMDRYLEIREEILRIGKEVEDASKSGNIERLQSARENYPKELQVYGVVKGADSQRQSIAKRIAAIKGNDRIPDEAKANLIKQLKDQEKAAMLRAIRAYNTVVEGMSVPPMEQPQ